MNRKFASTFFLIVSLVGSLFLAWQLTASWGAEASPAWLADYSDPERRPLLLVPAAILALLGYTLSFDTRRKRRPWEFILSAFFALGASAGLIGHEILAQLGFYEVDDPVLNEIALSLAVAGGVIPVLIVLGFEFSNRWLWSRLAHAFDQKDMAGPTLMCNRVQLYFRPGQQNMLRSVAMARFRKGERGDTARTLEDIYRDGRHDPDVLECLCQYAHEQGDREAYLEYLTELHKMLPGEDQIRDSLIDELVEQNRHSQALKMIEETGVSKSEEALERYAELLLNDGQIARAAQVAVELGEVEGIPFRRSQKVLRDILSRVSEHVPALNALAAQAERMKLREQRLRWLEKSYKADPRQREIREDLRDLYRESGAPLKLQELLEDILRDNPFDREALLELAEVLHQNGQDEEALDRLQDARGRGILSPKGYLLEAEIRFSQGEYDQAKDLAAEAEKRAQGESLKEEVEKLIAKIERAELSAEVAGVVEKARQNPDDLKLQFEALDKLIERGQGEKVVGLADQTIANHPDTRGDVIRRLQLWAENEDVPFPVLNFLTDLLVGDSRFDESLVIIKKMAERSLDKVNALQKGTQKILRRSPHHLPTLRALGDVYHEHGKYTEMIHSYSLYLSNGGEETEEVDRALAMAYISLEDYHNARRFVNELLESKPNDAKLIRRMIPLALKAEEAEDAAEYMKQLEIVDPRSVETTKLKNEVKEGLDKRRFSFLKRELESGKGGAEMLEQLGDLALDMANYNEAITCYQRAARDRSDENLARRTRAKLAFCYAKKRLDDMAYETLGEIRLSLDDDPEQIQVIMDLLYEIGEIFLEANQYERASRIFKQLVKIDAGYRDVLAKVEKLR